MRSEREDGEVRAGPGGSGRDGQGGHFLQTELSPLAHHAPASLRAWLGISGTAGTSHEPSSPEEPHLMSQHPSQLANGGLKQGRLLTPAQPSPSLCLQLIGTVTGLVHSMTLLQQLEKFLHRHTGVWGATQREDLPQEHSKRPPTGEQSSTVT